jgi:methylphosphotriester-DNA--protein-cysteine methyltransferase
MRIAGRPCWPAIRSLTISLSSPCRRPVFSAVRHAAPATRCVKMSAFIPMPGTPLRRGFRPCKRCMPDKRDPQAQKLAKVEHACRLLEQDPALTLERLAQQVAMSPFHFHRLFKSVTGMTPKAWQQAARGQRLRTALAQETKLPMPCWQRDFPTAAAIIVKPTMRWA